MCLGGLSQQPCWCYAWKINTVKCGYNSLEESADGLDETHLSRTRVEFPMFLLFGQLRKWGKKKTGFKHSVVKQFIYIIKRQKKVHRKKFNWSLWAFTVEMKVKSKRLHQLIVTVACSYRSLSNNRTKDRHAFWVHARPSRWCLCHVAGLVWRRQQGGSTTEGAFILHIHSQPCFHSGTGWAHQTRKADYWIKSGCNIQMISVWFCNRFPCISWPSLSAEQ